MIAFDLDGVFVSELVHNSEEELERVLTVRAEHLVPLFRVRFPFYLITARLKVDEEHTLRWINKVFGPEERPKRVFHDNADHTKPVDYKVSVLKEHPDITTFIESEFDQVDQISRLVPECRILHFERMIAPIFDALGN